ncbi:hypothetical protein BAUCODRAFT_158604, partial [Baudoinia panamericana UAMH 10762]
MAFELQPLESSDAERCVTIYFAAFQNPHSLAVWPRIATVRAWWEQMIRDELNEEGSHWRKAVFKDTGELVGYCKWRHHAAGQTLDTQLPEWPKGADTALADETFGAWVRMHPELMGSRAHWYLEMVATDPAY